MGYTIGNNSEIQSTLSDQTYFMKRGEFQKKMTDIKSLIKRLYIYLDSKIQKIQIKNK